LDTGNQIYHPTPMNTSSHACHASRNEPCKFGRNGEAAARCCSCRLRSLARLAERRLQTCVWAIGIREAEC
jgi:hypothetical protein